MRTQTVIALLILIVVAAVGGALFLRSMRQGAESGDARPPVRAVTPADLQAAPDFEIVLYQGDADVGAQTLALSRLWGTGRPVVLNFWAGLCPPCRVEMPDFQKLHADAQGRYVVIGVDIGPFIGLGTREEGKALLKDLGVTFPAGTTFEATAVGAYQILGMPTTVFITPEGKIFKKYAGLLTIDLMRTFVADLLKASGVQ